MKIPAVELVTFLVAGCASILANEGNNQVTAELASLKGQMKAMEETSIKKNCGIQFQQAS